MKTEALKDAALLAKSSLDITLVKEDEQDVKLAKLMKLGAVKSKNSYLGIYFLYFFCAWHLIN